MGSGAALLSVILVLYILNPGATGSASPGVNDTGSATSIPYPTVQRVSVTEARAAFDTEQALFLDVRAPEDYAAAHIPGALLIPISDLAGAVETLPTDAEIITYCT
jgi:3-mercaptopyruvate sulfurtransferase SseA